MRPLEGKIAVVAGATRGAGRGIACMLGEAGATVYCTGRSVRGRPSTPGRPETTDETAEMVAARGGAAVAVGVDHTDPEQVARLFDRVRAEQGRLDVLVNNVNGDDLTDWSHPFWKQSLEQGLRMFERGIHTHVITTRAALPLMLESGPGLVVGISDKGGMSFYHAFVKKSVMTMAELLAAELRPHGIAAVAVTPGFLRSEQVLEIMGVTEANWRDAVQRDPYFAGSETPFYVGRAVAALAADRRVMMKTGKVLASWELAEEYGFADVDGAQPHWDRFCAPLLDPRWEKIVKGVRAAFAKTDKEVPLESDRATTTLRARLSAEGEPPLWFTQEISFPEVVYGDPKRIAADFHQRWAQLR